jgi:hypothetical protein
MYGRHIEWFWWRDSKPFLEWQEQTSGAGSAGRPGIEHDAAQRSSRSGGARRIRAPAQVAPSRCGASASGYRGE